MKLYKYTRVSEKYLIVNCSLFLATMTVNVFSSPTIKWKGFIICIIEGWILVKDLMLLDLEVQLLVWYKENKYGQDILIKMINNS